jgi:hypothetical protein
MNTYRVKFTNQDGRVAQPKFLFILAKSEFHAQELIRALDVRVKINRIKLVEDKS